MSFDIYLAPLPSFDGSFDASAVDAMLARHADPAGRSLLTADGGADVYGRISPDHWLMLNHASGEEVWQVIWELAAAGPCVVLPVGTPSFVTALAHVARVPEEFPGPVVVVAGGDELRAAIVDEGLPSIRTADAPEALRTYIEAQGTAVSDLGVCEVAAAMTSWYVLQRVGDVDPDADGDMLLLQWGTYDWGEGPAFQYDLTRQLTTESEELDPAIWQLSLTAYFAPSAELEDLGRGDRWCHGPAGVADFQHDIMTAVVTASLAGRRPQRLQLVMDQVD